MSPTEFRDPSYRSYDFGPEPPRRRNPWIARGVVAALALGALGGLIMRPNLDDQPAAKQTATRKVEVPREPEGLEIVVAPPPQPVTPILPPAPQTAPVEGYTPQPIPRLPPPVMKAPAAPAAPRIVKGPVMRPYAQTVRQAPRGTRPSFNCRYARTTSERMVCADPSLAAADRRLDRAYREAIESGVPERVLRRQQDIWLGARESAARYGPEEVVRVYEARIAELQQMAY